jgi:hypothetical protein
MALEQEKLVLASSLKGQDYTLIKLGWAHDVSGNRQRVEKIMTYALGFSEGEQVYYDFTVRNNPYGEHHFGSFVFCGEIIFWKIEYYNLNFQMFSIN